MKKFLAVILALIILVLFPIVLLGTLTHYRLFTAPTIKHIIRASEVGENLPSIAVSYVKSEKSSLPLDEATLTQLASTAFPPDILYALTDTIVDTVSSWWDTDKPIEQLDLTIDLSRAKQQLSPTLDQYFSQLTQKLPPCDDTLIMEEFDLLSSDCLPTDVSFKDIFLQNIPDTINLQDSLQLSLGNSPEQFTVINQQVNLYRTYWDALQWIIWIGWTVIGFCFLGIILLRLQPRYAPFSWLGWLNLWLAVELVPIVVLVWLAPQFILPWITGTVDPTVILVISQALTALLAVYLGPLLWVMIGTFVSSIMWFIIWAVVKHHITSSKQNS